MNALEVGDKADYLKLFYQKYSPRGVQEVSCQLVFFLAFQSDHLTPQF